MKGSTPMGGRGDQGRSPNCNAVPTNTDTLGNPMGHLEVRIGVVPCWAKIDAHLYLHVDQGSGSNFVAPYS